MIKFSNPRAVWFCPGCPALSGRFVNHPDRGLFNCFGILHESVRDVRAILSSLTYARVCNSVFQNISWVLFFNRTSRTDKNKYLFSFKKSCPVDGFLSRTQPDTAGQVAR